MNDLILFIFWKKDFLRSTEYIYSATSASANITAGKPRNYSFEIWTDCTEVREK